MEFDKNKMVIDISSRDFQDVAKVIAALVESGQTLCVDTRRDGDNYEARIRSSAPNWWLSPEAKKLQSEMQRKMDEQLCEKCRPQWKERTAEPYADGDGIGLWQVTKGARCVSPVCIEDGRNHHTEEILPSTQVISWC